MNEVQEHIESVRADASQKYTNFAGQQDLQTKQQSHEKNLYSDLSFFSFYSRCICSGNT